MNQPALQLIRHQSGITLLEVLIAVVILSIGVLGLAGLQFAGLRNGQQSYQRSQAVLLASEIADYMRASRDQAILGSYQVSAAPGAPAVNCDSVACTPAQLATFDVYQWYTQVTSLLPSGQATITCSTTCAAGDVQTVLIQWDEARTGSVNSSYSVSLTP